MLTKRLNSQDLESHLIIIIETQFIYALIIQPQIIYYYFCSMVSNIIKLSNTTNNSGKVLHVIEQNVESNSFGSKD